MRARSRTRPERRSAYDSVAEGNARGILGTYETRASAVATAAVVQSPLLRSRTYDPMKRGVFRKTKDKEDSRSIDSSCFNCFTSAIPITTYSSTAVEQHTNIPEGTHLGIRHAVARSASCATSTATRTDLTYDTAVETSTYV